MSDLLKINVNEHTERKNGLTYLSWAWAWAEVLKIDPEADWEVMEYSDAQGCARPCMYLPDGTAMVKVSVSIKKRVKSCVLPVMNHRNQAIKNPDAFAINTAIMRCMTKAISMHGLGLYIYAGEDLPEGEEAAGDKKPAENVIPASFRSSPTMGEFEGLSVDEQTYITDLAAEVSADVAAGKVLTAVERIERENLDDSQKMALWSRLDSKTRAAIKKAQQTAKEAA